MVMRLGKEEKTGSCTAYMLGITSGIEGPTRAKVRKVMEYRHAAWIPYGAIVV